MSVQSNKTEKGQQTILTRLGLIVLNNKALFILIVLCCAISFGTDIFLQPRNLLNVIRQICISAIIGIGFTYVLTSGNMDLSVGRLLGLIGIIMGRASVSGWPFWAVILLGIFCGLVCGFLNGIVIVSLKLNPFIVTLATQQIFKGFSNILSSNTTIGNIDPMFKAIGQGYFLGIPIPIFIMLGLAGVMWFIMNRTSFGRHVVAMGGNPEAARVSGVNIDKTKVLVYMILGLCAALAAIVMNGRLDSAQPTAGADMEMDSIAAVVLGGTAFTGVIGKVIGTIFGCMIIGVINNGLNLLNVNTNWQLVAKGLVIVLAMILDTKSESLLKKSSSGKKT